MSSSTRTTQNDERESLLDTKKSAKFLNVNPKTMIRWRMQGIGPQFIRIGARTIRYRLRDLERWLERRTYNNTAAYGVNPDQLYREKKRPEKAQPERSPRGKAPRPTPPQSAPV